MDRVTTERLTLRPWQLSDAASALSVYGDPDIVRWLSPAMSQVGDVRAMRSLLEQWTSEEARTVAPAGRWAIDRREDGELVGAIVLLPLPPGNQDLEIGWQLRRDAWGHGYASEAGLAIARRAFGQGLDELFAVVRPANTRAAATALRTGMEWVGETEKYYGLRLQVYRLRAADLPPTDPPARG